MNLLLFRNFPT